MLIYLLRHADAVFHAASDSQRELTTKGVAQAGMVGQFCRKQELAPSRIFTSPFLRAKQTALLVAKELETSPMPPEVMLAPFLASGMEPKTALEELRTQSNPPSMMLVGHEPDLGQLVSHLVGCSASFINIRKASLTLIEMPSLNAGAGILHFSIPVKFMFP